MIPMGHHFARARSITKSSCIVVLKTMWPSVAVKQRKQATLLESSKYEVSLFTVTSLSKSTTNDHLSFSHLKVTGLTIAGLIAIIITILIIVWLRKMRRLQKRLKRVETELRGKEVYFNQAGPAHFSSLSSDDEQL